MNAGPQTEEKYVEEMEAGVGGGGTGAQVGVGAVAFLVLSSSLSFL